MRSLEESRELQIIEGGIGRDREVGIIFFQVQHLCMRSPAKNVHGGKGRERSWLYNVVVVQGMELEASSAFILTWQFVCHVFGPSSSTRV